jgi:cytochrome P450 family 2 subfamily J
MLPQRKQREEQDYFKIWKSYSMVSPIFSYFLYELYNALPSIMKYLPGPHQTVFRNWERLKMIVYHMMESHRKDWNPDEPRDFIDAFLTEMTKVKKILPGCS